MSSVEDLAFSLKSNFGVILSVLDISSNQAPCVQLMFNDSHSGVIEDNLLHFTLDGIKISAEMIAKMNNWVLPFNSIASVILIHEKPYEIHIEAETQLIYPFVFKILSPRLEESIGGRG